MTTDALPAGPAVHPEPPELGTALPADRQRTDRPARGRPWLAAPAGTGLGRDARWWSGAWAALIARYSGTEQVWLTSPDGCYAIPVDAAAPVDELIAAAAAALSSPPALPADSWATSATRGPVASIAGYPGEQRGSADIAVELAADTVTLAGDPELWDVATLERLAGQLRLLAAEAAAAPVTPLTGLDLLTAADRQLISDDWNRTAAAWPHGGYLELLAAQVQVRPDAPAVEHGGTVISFAALDRRSNQVAQALRRAGVTAGGRVGLFCPRSADYVLAAIGTLKAGAAIVPLDPVNPDSRTAFMLADSAADAILTRDELRSRLPVTGAAVIDIAATADAASGPLASGADADPISHLVYTSGSTGEPKAVLERLRAVENLVHWTGRAYGVRPGDRASWLSAPGFGVQIMEWMPYLALGATVCMPAAAHALSPGQIRDWLVAEKVTHTMLVAALAEPTWGLDWPVGTALRIMVTTAERVHSWPVEGTPFRVVMTYGTSETTNALTCLDIGAGIDLTSQATSPQVKAAHPVPAGRPIANMQAYVLDDSDRPVPPGITGRLLLSGAGLSAGYHNRDDLTAARFRPHPVTGAGLAYETGDLARYRADGAIEILGRGDSQVKIRGFRVELGEVESALAACPEVAEAVVTAYEAVPGDRRLAAYVTAADGAKPDAAALKARLSDRLPYYMVPPVVTLLPAIPRLPNGKTDLRALPAPGEVAADSEGFVPARTETEAAMARLWGALFSDRTVSMTDNFFELGGHSLLAFRLIDELRRQCGVELSMTDLYASPTAGALSTAVEAGRAGSAGFADLPPLQPDPAARFEPFPLAEGQQAMWIGRGDLVDLGGVGCHGYFEWESGDLDADRFERAWRALVERHDALRSVVLPDGTQQVLAEVPPFPLPRRDLSHWPAADAEREVLAIREHLAHVVLDADRWPLFDVRLTLLPGGRTRIHLALDFLFADAWSYFQVIVPELSELYAGRKDRLEPLRLTFRDYVLGVEKNLADSEIYRRSRWYWLDRLESLPGAPQLPERPATQAALPARFERYSGTFNGADWQALIALASEHGATGSGALAAVYAEVLRSWTAEPSFCLNFPLFSRLPLHPQVTGVIGHTTTTLLLEVTGGGRTFADRAQELQRQLWSDLEHRHFTGIQVLRELTKLRGTLVPAMPVVMTSLAGYPPDQRDCPFGSAVYGISQTPQVSLDFQVFETAGGGLRFNWDYVPAVYPDGLIGEMFAAFRDLLSRLTSRAGWETESFGYGTARPAAVTAGADAAVADAGAARTGAAWEQYWASVRATGRGGDVLWDADSADEMGWLLDTAGRYLDPALPVIDLGCGNGRYARVLATRYGSVLGVDVSPTAIAKAREESAGIGNLSFEVLDVSDPQALAVLAARVGPANVFVRAVLHILGDTERAGVAATVSILAANGGSAVLVEPDYDASSFGYLGFVGGTRGRATDLVRPLERAGVRHSTHFGPDELGRFFPPERWKHLAAEQVAMHAVDPESDQATIRVPGFFAVVRLAAGSLPLAGTHG